MTTFIYLTHSIQKSSSFLQQITYLSLVFFWKFWMCILSLIYRLNVLQNCLLCKYSPKQRCSYRIFSGQVLNFDFLSRDKKSFIPFECNSYDCSKHLHNKPFFVCLFVCSFLVIFMNYLVTRENCFIIERVYVQGKHLHKLYMHGLTQSSKESLRNWNCLLNLRSLNY